MKFQDLKKYLGVFILAAAVIIIYKTFDNLGEIFDSFGSFLNILMPFFIGAAIAFLLRIPCKRTEILFHKSKLTFLKKHRRGLAVLSVYILLIAAISLIMFAIIPQLVKSIKMFIDQLPSMSKSLVDWFNSLGIYPIDELSVQNLINSNLLSFDELLKILDFSNMNKYAQGVMNVGSSVVDIFLGIVISIYMLLERKGIRKALSKFSRLYIPEKVRKNISFYSRTVTDFIYRYISCQLLDAVIVFILCLIVLSIMRIEYAAVIALMVGTFNLIPYFGAFVACFIAALITLITSGSIIPALILVAVLIVIQQVDANLIQPRLVASTLSIKPLWVIFGVVLGGGLFGVIGMFLGVPIVALIRTIVIDAVNKKASSIPPLPEQPSGE